ncbi:MAG: hypothetical protein MUF00_00725 [Gemmatimonadaceae bacterium]|jgi:photosystem II stability/assembly factor-like uncharacterized protein|nr:hypothetical protein [Gemmatimonadaceae bacterium]
MPASALRRALVALLVTGVVTADLPAQDSTLYSALHWRHVGPIRGGRARVATGVTGQLTTLYIGFDNGGLWRSTDFGANWVSLFDGQSTGSIGAMAAAPSDPNVLYVGSGAGIIRPDLAVGNGMYKSTDAGKTWTHLGLRDTRMIAMVDVDPRNADRLFVAALGHPYGPNEERGIFRSTNGGRTFEKVLYKDAYTSGNDVRIDPSNPDVVYAALWQQQQSFIEGQGFGGGNGGLFKSVDGGTTWTPMTAGLPAVHQANLALAPSNPRVLYVIAAALPTAAGAPIASGPVGIYKSVDGGASWYLAASPPGEGARTPDQRPLARIGGGDLPTLTVDPTNENVLYSSSVVLWRSEDGGRTWSAVRGAPGGDDYQRTWIHPTNPNIILTATDQGAVVSANRGESWSDWYNQPTAAMYHVTADDAFPYRLCGGQQDSGSACVPSRSGDGKITFSDWHPVNIQEYGIAAPDPRDPDVIFGSQRGNVTKYDRRTKQTVLVGPDMTAVGPNGERYNRNVRTMPLHFSPINRDLLFYVSNAVWKSADRGQSWTRISPDLTRQSWAVPTNAGQYASTVKPAPAGAITALAPSARDVRVLWAGTDDGHVQVTMNGGTSWTNVTPPAVKPWTRIFNIDAGRHDARTAYVAANTLRLDELTPRFYRTHDGGATWTDISVGLPPDAVANSIREDPRVSGLLYAATDHQVWVSFDDGSSWSSLKQNMPTISVRDLRVKDDSSCLCSDLVVGTHGRGFWILDNITPLRQIAAARAARSAHRAHLFAPSRAVRVRFATNDPTPWPPEVPGGENPMPGAAIDYLLPRDASQPITLEILDAAGRLVRRHVSAAAPLAPHPGVDPANYDAVCRRTPTAPFCAFPLYWPAPPIVLSGAAGMHRFHWDLHFDPVVADDEKITGALDATGAVPRRTYPSPTAPWAPPGRYTVRLTVDGQPYEQPLTVHLDPRVRTSAAGLAQLHALTTSLYRGAQDAYRAYEAARALGGQLAGATDADAIALRAQLDSLAPAMTSPRSIAAIRRRPAAAGAPTLMGASDAQLAAALAMHDADVTPTARQLAAATTARAQATQALAAWTRLRTTRLAALNAKRRAAGLPTVGQ